MKTRHSFLILFLLFFTSISFSQITTIWEKSSAQSNYPKFMGTGNTERGFAYGKSILTPVAKNWAKSVTDGNYPAYLGTGNTERGFAYGNNHLYVVSRKASPNSVFILDAANGDSLGALDITNISGGTFIINDAEVSDDGIIFVCNLTTNASTSPFKIYRWDTEGSAPVQVVNYVDLAIRLGDKFAVTGSTADNSIVIWAVGASSNSVVKFTTTDNGATFTPEVITLSDGNVAGSPAIWPQADQTKFFINSNGVTPKQYAINGTFESTLDGSIVSTGSNAMRSVETGANQYLVVYNYGASAENLRFVDISSGFANAVLMQATETLGTNSNANGTGDVDLKDNGDGTYTAFILSTNNGIASYTFNPQKFGNFDRVYLASRLSGNKIIKLDAATGDSLGTLDVTGISGGALAINDVEVSDDGQIFVCNLTTNASTSPFKVYKYSDEYGLPSEAINYTASTALRLGDKITVTGSAIDNTLTIWAVAGSSTSIVKFTTTDNGATFTPEIITLSDAASGTSPAVWPMDTLLYVNGNGITPKSYQVNGTFVEAVPSSIVSTGSNALRTFGYDGKNYLAVYNYGATAAENLRVLDITNGLAAASLLHTTNSLGSVSNGNGTGDVDYIDNGDGTFNLFILGTNNGIAAYKFQPPQKVMPVEFTPAAGTYYDSVDVTLSTPTLNAKIYYTLDGTTPDSASALLYSAPITLKDTTTIKAIAYAENMIPSDTSFASYIVIPVVNVTDIATLRTSPMDGTVYRLQSEAVLTFKQTFRNQKYIQDTTAAVLIDDNSGKITTEYNVGDGITGIIGTTMVYGNMTEFVPVFDPGPATSSNNIVEPQVITLPDFKNNFEDYEAELVKINNLTFLDGDGIKTFANGKVYKITDGIDTVDFRTTFYDVDYIGEPIFSEIVNIVGLPNSRTAGNYLSARNLADFGIVPPEPMELFTYWAFNNRHGNIPAYFLKAGQNYERSMAYGNVDGKDRLYVVSRSGGPHIVVHDADNGAIIKEIAEPQPQVGLFPLNCVDVSDDGVIFACNMTLDATSSAPFTVYKWDNEDATPTIAFQYSGGGRMGDMFSVSGSVSDNSLVILAGIKDNAAGKVVKATTANTGTTFDLAEMVFTGLTQGTNPNFQVAADGTIWAKSYGKLLTHHNADGTIIDTVSGDIVATSGSKIKYMMERDSSEIILVYYANVGAGEKNEKVVGIDVTKGSKKAFVRGFTPVLGNVSNGNATGGVDYRFVDDSTLVVYVLGTNNGIGAYSNNKLIPTVHPYPAKDLVLSDGESKNIRLKWQVQGGQGNVMSLNNGEAVSGFFQLPNKAYGAIFDLSSSPTAKVSEIDFGHAGFDFFEGEAKYIVHAFNMDTQAEVFKSDTLVTVVAFPWEVKWESGIKLGNGIQGVSKLGIFIEALTLDNFGNTWPTVMTDSQVPPVANGQVVIDVTNPFVDIKNPSDNGLGNFLIDIWGSFTIPTKVVAEPVQTAKAYAAISKEARKFNSVASTSNPRREKNADNIESAVSTFNIYRGTSVNDLALIATTVKNVMTYEDVDVADGFYTYAVSTVSVSGEESELVTAEINHIGVGVEENIPATFMLSQNYPNPFNPATEIKFGLKVNSKVTLNVYNVIGEKVATLINKDMSAGYSKVSFNGANLASGIYFYRIEANGVDGSKFVDTKKMILIK